MKTIYIPKGETACYESLETEHLIVKGCVKSIGSIRAKTISGDGTVFADSIMADDIRARFVEADSVICQRFLANGVQTRELVASDSAAVATYLSAKHVKTGRLIVTVNEADTVDAEKVIQLGASRRSLFLLLLSAALRTLWAWFSHVVESRMDIRTGHGGSVEKQKPSGFDAATQAEIARIVRETLRQQVQEENAEAHDIDIDRIFSEAEPSEEHPYGRAS